MNLTERILTAVIFTTGLAAAWKWTPAWVLAFALPLLVFSVIAARAVFLVGIGVLLFLKGWFK